MRRKRSQQRKNKITRILLINLTVLLIGLLALGGFYLSTNSIAESSKQVASEKLLEKVAIKKTDYTEIEKSKPEPKKEPYTDIQIAAAGDIMFHGPQLKAGYDTASDSYDFTDMFSEVKPIFEAADLAIANYETTAGGAEKGFTGYPAFNSPDETIDAIKDAGIDVVTTVNNHSLDTGRDGLERTVKVMREKELPSVGTYDKKPTSRVYVHAVEEIDVAILAYTEKVNPVGIDFSAKEMNEMLNLMDEQTIKEDVAEAKELGADLIISFMHWGEEYVEEPNDRQIEFAEMMAAEGVDIILGSHPHVIQKSDFIVEKEQTTFVIYSMGNFISNQREETLGTNRKITEDGVIVQLDVRKDNIQNEISIEDVSYIPTWVYRNQEQGESTFTYKVLPIEDTINDSIVTDAFKQRMNRSLETTSEKMAPYDFIE